MPSSELSHFLKIAYTATDNLIQLHNYKEPSQVLPYLFLGSGSNAKDRSCLKKNDISAILNLAPIQVMTSHYYYPNTWKYKEINATDNDSFALNQYFKETYEYIEECKEEGRKIFVHCGVGISRAPTIIMAYLLQAIHNNTLSINDLTNFRKTNKEYPKQIQELITNTNITENKNLYNIIAHIILCRPIIEPNQGFLTQLETLSNEIN